MLVGNTHLVAGGRETIAEVLALLKKGGTEIRGNPDLYVRTYRHFGIDEARELRERASLRAVRDRRIFIIAAPDMNREAQNALLKTIEEPPGNALFFFIIPSPGALLPTLYSRAQVLVMERNEQRREIVDAKTFLSALPQRRLDLLKPLLEKGEDDKRDLGAILDFLSSIERAFEKKANAKGLSAVYRARKYVTDKGALVKPLLEQVALLVPKV